MNNIIKLVRNAYSHLNNGNIDCAEKILNTMKAMEMTPELKYSLSSVLIEVGTTSKNMDYIDEGIKNFEELKNDTEYNVDYNLGNGYSSKYKIMDKKPNYLTKKEHLLSKAKIHYLNGINNPPEQNPQIYINLGNTYDYIGRTIDALEYYEKSPNHPYALINKGIGLFSYSTFINNPTPVLKDAYECFDKVLKIKNIPTEFIHLCNTYMKKIEEQCGKKLLKEKNDKKLKRPSNNNFEGFLTNFCLDNKLYLNLCNFCQRCDNAIGDTLLIPNMLVKIGTPLEEDPYLKLSSQLNQIKLDYIISRFLLILSQTETSLLDLISKNTILTETLSYEENNSSVQLLKNSFTSFYNILDKISHLINIYFKLKKNSKYLNFHKVWDNKKGNINGKLRNLNNIGLSALYDIHLELEPNHEKFYLREMRNNLTHNFVPIKLVKLEDNDMTYEELRNNTIELAKIVKNAIIYLVRAIDINERKKSEKNKDKIIPKMNSETIKL